MFLRTYLALEATFKNMWVKLETNPFTRKLPFTACILLVIVQDQISNDLYINDVQTQSFPFVLYFEQENSVRRT